MKLILAIGAVFMAAVINVRASISDFITFAASPSTNWTFFAGMAYTPDAVVAKESRKFGAVLGAVHSITDYTRGGVRLDNIGGNWWSANATVAIQADVKLFNYVTVTPFVEGGIASSLSGGENDGELQSIAGAGISTRIWSFHKAKIDGVLKLAYAAETWSGEKGTRHLFGPVLNVSFP